MEGKMQAQDVKLIQVFLSQNATPSPAIYEVSSTIDGKLICTCPGYSGRGSCKHARFVTARIKTNGGTYPLEISKKATKEEADRAQESTDAFRDFIIKFGKIEVY
jgi:hypothetical protein